MCCVVTFILYWLVRVSVLVAWQRPYEGHVVHAHNLAVQLGGRLHEGDLSEGRAGAAGAGLGGGWGPDQPGQAARHRPHRLHQLHHQGLRESLHY